MEQFHAPEKWNSTHESHQKRRISNRRQTSSHVRDQEDKEDHDVTLSFSP